MAGWVEEYRMYRRDQKGEIIKLHDHYMDATRYAIQTGLQHAKPVNMERQMVVSSRNYGV